MNSDASPSSFTLDNDTHTLQAVSDESYVLSLPDSFNQNLTVSPGQTLSLDLPCIFDVYSTSLTCEVVDNLAPSWATIDCANSQIEIQQSSEVGNASDSFSIKSTYLDGEFVNNFNITLVA